MAGPAQGLSAAGSGLKAFGAIESGYNKSDNDIAQGTQTANFDQYKAQQLQDSADIGRTKASQTSLFMQQLVARQLGQIAAIGGAADVSADSPTSAAIAARTQGQMDRERGIKTGNELAQAAMDQKGSAIYTKAAQDTLNQAYMNAGNDVLGGWLSGIGSFASSLAGLGGVPG